MVKKLQKVGNRDGAARNRLFILAVSGGIE